MTTIADTDVSVWTKAELARYVGGLSNPSKMPGFGYSLPAQECITGGKLQEVPGTVCFDCYALKNRYLFPKVISALYRRLESLTKPLWTRVMAELINRTGNDYFRWHDAGDLQSREHLEQIMEVCRLTPEVRHWLPTRELKIVKSIDLSKVPANLNIRVSAHLVDGPAPEIEGLTASTVSTESARADSRAHVCPAPKQGNNCGDCRACWDPNVAIVDYHFH